MTKPRAIPQSHSLDKIIKLLKALKPLKVLIVGVAIVLYGAEIILLPYRFQRWREKRK